MRPPRHSALAWTAASLAAVILGCLAGPVGIGLGEAARIIAHGLGLPVTLSDPGHATVLLHLRLPRVLLAYGVGAGLAVAGGAYQGILRNPLADPFTLGVSTGAAFGASLVLGFGPALGIGAAAAGLLPWAALLGALGALGAVLALARLAGGAGQSSRETLVLAGIVTATFLASGIALIKALHEESVGAIVFWLMGSFQGRGWRELWLFAPYGLVGAAVLLLRARELDLLSLGGRQAELLGLSAKRERLLLLTAASCIGAAGVAVSGVIGFVGLIVPHLVRAVTGGSHGKLLAACLPAGGILLVLADGAARTLAPGGAELPVGVLTSMLGAPFFILVLMRRGRNRGSW